MAVKATTAVMAIRKRVDGPELDGPEIFEKIAKKYQCNLDSFQTHQLVTQKLQFQYQMHREAVQFVFFCCNYWITC